MRFRADDSVNRWRDFGPASGFDIDFLRCSTRLYPLASIPTPGRLLRKSGLHHSPDRPLHQAQTRIPPSPLPSVSTKP